MGLLNKTKQRLDVMLMQHLAEKNNYNKLRERVLKNRKEYERFSIPLRSEYEAFPGETLHKYTYHLKLLMKNLFAIDYSFTIEELVKEIQKLSTKVYETNKEITLKENEIHKNNDTKRFKELKHELESLKTKKSYLQYLEHVLIRNNLLMNFTGVLMLINDLQYSGNSATKEDVKRIIYVVDVFMQTYSEFDKNIAEIKKTVASSDDSNNNKGFFAKIFGK